MFLTVLNLLAYLWIAALIALSALFLWSILCGRIEKEFESKNDRRAAYAEYKRMGRAARQEAYAKHKAAWERVRRGGR
jgi:hypothetical protein